MKCFVIQFRGEDGVWEYDRPNDGYPIQAYQTIEQARRIEYRRRLVFKDQEWRIVHMRLTT